MKMSQLPNFITSLRILGTFFLIFTPYENFKAFIIIYTLTGISDILDGFIARKMNTTSEFGANLDSVADLFFYAVMLIRLLPTLLVKMKPFIWYSVAVVFALRIAAYIVAAVKYHRFASLHTYMNKVTGAAVFTAPYIMPLSCHLTICFIICVIGAVASAEELTMHIIAKNYDPKKRTLFHYFGKGLNPGKNTEAA